MSSRLLGTHVLDKTVEKDIGIEVTTVPMFNFGLMVLAKRGVDKVVEIFNMNEFFDKFGTYDQNFYGAYVLFTFFRQITNAPVKAFIKRFVASDAIVATATLQDDGPADTLQLDAAYFGILDKGKWGNSIGYEIEHTSLVNTALAVAGAVADVSITVDSVARFEVGDIIKIDHTSIIYKKVTVVDEDNNTLAIAGTLVAILSIDVTVETLNFDLKVWERSDTGAITPKEPCNFLSMEDETSNYIEKILNDEFKGSKFFFGTDLDSGSAIEDTRPAETTAIVYLADGADGTAPTNTTWQTELTEFDIHPVRVLANSDSQADSVNSDGEAYCKTRGNCIWLSAGSINMTFAEAKIWGATFLISGQNYSMGDMQWWDIDDPIGVGDNPLISIPPVGVTAGYWFQTIFDRGFHKNPGGLTKSIVGVRDLVMNDQTEKDVLDAKKRTELADMGVNVFQFQKGRGFIRRSARMFSSNKKYRYAAGMFMKAIIKESVKVSVEDAEMESLGFEWLREIKVAVRAYMKGLHKSSTNNGTESAFYQGLKSDQSPTTFDDVVDIVADDSNNTNSALLDGEANVDTAFVPPPPAESVFIGVDINVIRKEA